MIQRYELVTAKGRHDSQKHLYLCGKKLFKYFFTLLPKGNFKRFLTLTTIP